MEKENQEIFVFEGLGKYDSFAAKNKNLNFKYDKFKLRLFRHVIINYNKGLLDKDIFPSLRCHK